MTEPRLKRSDDRIDDRAINERVTSDRALSEDRAYSDIDIRQMLRAQISEAKLPNPPARPGWHRVWLSTQNDSDSIPARMRLGYTKVDAATVPEGFPLEVAEMRLYEIPDQLYQAIMHIQHHENPLESERDIKARVRRGGESGFGAVKSESDGDTDDGFVVHDPGRTRIRFA